MTRLECRRELEMIHYCMGLVDIMFANGFTLFWWVSMYGHIVDCFVAVAEAWAVLDRAEVRHDATV